MSDHIFKSHNKTVLLYHLVFPAKYRMKVFTKEVENALINICIEISERHEINFIEIGNNEDHVHFLIFEKGLIPRCLASQQKIHPLTYPYFKLVKKF